jgi:hypothetical protein
LAPYTSPTARSTSLRREKGNSCLSLNAFWAAGVSKEIP